MASNGTIGTLIISSDDTVEILYNSPAVILAKYIWDVLGIMNQPSTAGSYPLYINLLPDGNEIPSNAGAIYDTSGVMDGRLTRGISIEHYGIQVKIRNTDYQQGWQKIREVCSYFENVLNQEVVVSDRSFNILSIMRASPIAYIGFDDKRRYEFTVNFLVSMKEI